MERRTVPTAGTRADATPTQPACGARHRKRRHLAVLPHARPIRRIAAPGAGTDQYLHAGRLRRQHANRTKKNAPAVTLLTFRPKSFISRDARTQPDVHGATTCGVMDHRFDPTQKPNG